MSALRRAVVAVVAAFLASCALPGSAAASAAFDVVVLGDAGGLAEDDLTSFLLFPAGGDAGIALDAGTLHAGIRAALRAGAFAGFPLQDDGELTPEGQVLQTHVKAYLVSHAHLDHVAGLILGSTDNAPKPILALPATLAVLRDQSSTGVSGPTSRRKARLRRCHGTRSLRSRAGSRARSPGRASASRHSRSATAARPSRPRSSSSREVRASSTSATRARMPSRERAASARCGPA